MDLDELEVDLHERSQPLDPSYPRYAGGPWHQNASAQHLIVITKMMGTVGLLQFRPNFAESASSRENKWLWDLSLKIFLKLVEYGEFPGVSLEEANVRESIKTCFSTYVQSLKKRFDIIFGCDCISQIAATNQCV